MPERLSALDVSFLYLERRGTPMHVGEVAIFEPSAEGFDYERLVQLVEERISLVPRYRQKISWVPGRLANPVWVDDPDFDVTYHVRRSGLPRPGTDAQLFEFCARVHARKLDRHRPLWEMYLIEGLAGGRIALATKSHRSMVDGIDSMDLEQVILDVSAVPPELPDEFWMPEPPPSSTELVLGAVSDIARSPGLVADTVRMGVADVRGAARHAMSRFTGALSAVRSAIVTQPANPLNAAISQQCRFAVARTRLADYQKVHREQDVPVNDVILATIAGALRDWMLFRGELAASGTVVRAMVPVGDRLDEPPGGNGVVSPLYVDLPVGEPNPMLRLAQVSFAAQADRESNHSMSVDRILEVTGFAPLSLHTMGARIVGGRTRRFHNVMVTNVPGPQLPLYAAGAHLLEMFPVVPLHQGQVVAIALTSYNGGVYFGLNGDRDAMPDVEVLGLLIEESLAELVAASAEAAARLRRRRAKTAASPSRTARR